MRLMLFFDGRWPRRAFPVLAEYIRPQRRAAETFGMRFWNQPFTVTVGFYADGRPGEVFVDIAKSGADIAGIARDVGGVISLALEHHVEIETLRQSRAMHAAKLRRWSVRSSMRSSFEVQHDARRP